MASEDEPARHNHDDPAIFGLFEFVQLSQQAEKGLWIGPAVQDDRFAAGPTGHFTAVRLKPVGDTEAGSLESFPIDLTFVAGRTNEEDLSS